MKTVDVTGMVGEAVELVPFLSLDFIGEPKFLHPGVGIITWGGEDWEGVGGLGTIDAVRDTLGLAPTRVRVSLMDPVAEYLNEALNEATWGRLAELYVAGWDGAALSSEPTLLIRGRMGPPEIYVGETNKISVVIEDVRAMMDRVNGLRSTMLEHQQEAPGDTFYRLLPKMVDHRFIFNGGTFGGNNVTPAPTVDPRDRPRNPTPGPRTI